VDLTIPAYSNDFDTVKISLDEYQPQAYTHLYIVKITKTGYAPWPPFSSSPPSALSLC